MARNKITKAKTLKKLSNILGREVALALTRGGTDHRVDCGCSDGTAWQVWPDGSFEQIEGARYVPGEGIHLKL